MDDIEQNSPEVTPSPTSPSSSKLSMPLIGAVILVAIVLIGGFLLLSNKKPSLSEESTESRSESSQETMTPLVSPTSLASPSAAPTKQITLAEIAKHATESDCWMAIEGKVYDVTSFIGHHPGGQAILQGCGKDATSMFNSRPNDGTSHDQRARDLLPKYQIGVLKA